MENLVFTQLSIPEIRQLFRQELETYFKTEKPAPITAPANPLLDEYITRKAAARLLGITLPTLHKYSITGKVPAYRIARQVRYKKSEVEKSLLQFKTFPQDLTA